MGYAFRKLYADLVAPDGTVCIAYLAWLDLWGFRSSCHAGLELYWPDGRREVIRGRGSAKPGSYSRIGPDLELSIDVPGGPFVLRHRALSGGFEPTGAPCDGIRWRVTVGQAEAQAGWLGDRRRPTLVGTGYADWVEIARPTRCLGLDRVCWGRAHLRDTTLVWNRVRLREGSQWQTVARANSGGALAECGAMPLPVGKEWPDDGLTTALGGVRIAERRVLHEGPAIDPARFPSAAERWTSAVITGRAHERRSLGRLRSLHAPEESGWAVYESVDFRS